MRALICILPRIANEQGIGFAYTHYGHNWAGARRFLDPAGLIMHLNYRC